MKPCVVSDREGFPEPKVTKSPKPKRLSRSWNQNVFDNNWSDIKMICIHLLPPLSVRVVSEKLEKPVRIQVLFVHTVYYECIEMVPDVNQVVLNSDPRQISHVKAQTVWALHSKATIITKQPIIAKTTYMINTYTLWTSILQSPVGDVLGEWPGLLPKRCFYCVILEMSTIRRARWTRH